MGIGIREAREKLPSLIKRAAFAEEDIPLGTRGNDEVTLVSTGKYARLLDELARLRAEVRELRRGTVARADSNASHPFAGLQRALDAGALPAASEPRARRLIHGESGTSSVVREDRIRLGSRGSDEPKYRRTGPRA